MAHPYTGKSPLRKKVIDMKTGDLVDIGTGEFSRSKDWLEEGNVMTTDLSATNRGTWLSGRPGIGKEEKYAKIVKHGTMSKSGSLGIQRTYLTVGDRNRELVQPLVSNPRNPRVGENKPIPFGSERPAIHFQREGEHPIYGHRSLQTWARIHAERKYQKEHTKQFRPITHGMSV